MPPHHKALYIRDKFKDFESVILIRKYKKMFKINYDHCRRSKLILVY